MLLLKLPKLIELGLGDSVYYSYNGDTSFVDINCDPLDEEDLPSFAVMTGIGELWLGSNLGQLEYQFVSQLLQHNGTLTNLVVRSECGLSLDSVRRILDQCPLLTNLRLVIDANETELYSLFHQNVMMKSLLLLLCRDSLSLSCVCTILQNCTFSKFWASDVIKDDEGIDAWNNITTQRNSSSNELIVCINCVDGTSFVIGGDKLFPW